MKVTSTKLLILKMISLLLFSLNSLGGDFPVCPSTVGARNALDGFCPRLEGAHLPDCCPPVRGTTLHCTYGEEDTYSTYSKGAGGITCQGGAGGTDVFVPECCNVEVINCKKSNYIELDFITRPIKRPFGNPEVKQCCFEAVCPLKNYWMAASAAAPQAGKINLLKAKANDPRFERINRPLPICQISNPEVCGGLPMCSSLTGSCPPVQNPQPTSTATATGTGTGTSTGIETSTATATETATQTYTQTATATQTATSTNTQTVTEPPRYDQGDKD